MLYLNLYSYVLLPNKKKNRSILDLTGVKEEYLENPNFSYLATFLPIVNYDINLLKLLLGKENVDTESKAFNQRL